MKKNNTNLVAFTGGGTAGHIYPGLAVADELKQLALKKGIPLEVEWIGCSKGMDRKIVESSKGSDSNQLCKNFYGIPSGKLRRYFSLKNFSDLFRILAGFFCAFHILRKTKPAVLFSKGGFVSVPPCVAAHLLKIPVFIHECDFTLGLANRINFRFADKMLVSYEATKNNLSEVNQKKVIVTGNPVRPVFYNAEAKAGLEFLGIEKNKASKPVLLVLGGSSGAKQINELVQQNIEYLCKNFIVVHQTGLVNTDGKVSEELKEKYPDYHPFDFIYSQMPDVLACADVVLSRSGANSLWEAAVLSKPLVLIPLCGSGTRGDQVDNAEFFKEKGAAKILVGTEATDENLCKALDEFLDTKIRSEYSDNLRIVVGEGKRPSEKIAELIFEKIGY